MQCHCHCRLYVLCDCVLGDRDPAAVAVAAAGHHGAGGGHQVAGASGHQRVHAAPGRAAGRAVLRRQTQLPLPGLARRPRSVD